MCLNGVVVASKCMLCVEAFGLKEILNFVDVNVHGVNRTERKMRGIPPTSLIEIIPDLKHRFASLIDRALKQVSSS